MQKEAMLYEKLADEKVHCYLCPHHCKIAESKLGICGVRQNLGGTLYTLVYGEIIASHVDPIEKKPLYHFLPGSTSFSIATIGCNFRCGFCQNWQISQASKREVALSGAEKVTPEDVVRAAERSRSKSISYTYTEPTIFFELAYDTAKLAKEAGLYNNFVTNGYMTKEALETIRPYLDAANVDLKSFREDFYRRLCSAHLEPVIETIRRMHELGVWIEVTTLVIPGQNDSEEELADIARFLADVGKEIPWHLSRFHPDYKLTDADSTPVETLRKAREVGKQHGLRYIYLGNVLEGNDTHCYNCGETIIRRGYMDTRKVSLKNGICPSCGTPIDGVWA
jgi:pyruvate formate lyase activating enzyme